MASDKKKNYSTEGLNSRQEVQDALASAGYRPSEQVTEAEAALKAQQSAAPGDYQSRYQDQIDRTLNDLNARRAFHYNYAQDPLYQQYAQAYTQNAHNASADAAAQAAALTGGYGSSYAASVAQQAYQQQIGALNQAIPTLYQLALDTYDSGGDALVSQLDQLNTQEQNAQGLYQQKLSDYYTRLEQLGLSAGLRPVSGLPEPSGHPVWQLRRAGTGGRCPEAAAVQQCDHGAGPHRRRGADRALRHYGPRLAGGVAREHRVQYLREQPCL